MDRLEQRRAAGYAIAVPLPYHIFGFWTGENAMPPARVRNWNGFDTTGLEPILVTPESLHRWVVSERPLHPAYQYLSPVHRSDYLRPYFMYHHGGGYADIKRQTGSWLPAVERLSRSRWLIGAGYREIKGGTVWLQDNAIERRTYVLSHAVPPICAKLVTHAMRGFYPWMIGNGAFYFKPGTRYARIWLREVERRLDMLMPKLKGNPPAHPRDRLGGLEGHAYDGYPVPWSFLLGDINGPLSLLHAPLLSRSLPVPSFTDYI
ncbi:MAG: hypothetical protein JWN69_1838 [Alphaproteobacteria bacterium]|nr:hypothetical protein [Alphaproteobacteria bacterium]